MRSSKPLLSPAAAPPKSRADYYALLLLVGFVASFMLLMSYVHIISELPRPMQGESVMIPWSACLAGYLSLPALLPWFVSLPFIPHWSVRLYFIVFLFTAVLAWYFAFGFDSLLDKAYRRGL